MGNPFAFLRLDRLPGLAEQDLLRGLPEKLRQAGFDESLANSFLQVGLGPVAVTALLRRYNQECPAHWLYRLWLLAQWVPRPPLEAVLGRPLVTRLVEWGLVAESEHGLGATVDLYPLDGDYLVTDRQIGVGRRPHSVYPLGIDSYSLQRLIPRSRFERALDLCTGSGIQALTARAGLTHAVDLSPRAVDFASFNLSLNRPGQNHQVFQGALFKPLPEGRYDLIVTNPPWVPTPDQEIELYRGGGLDGERLTREVVQEVSDWLTQHGQLVMYVEYPRYAGQTYLERERGWLGGSGWGLALVHLRHFSTEEYVAGQVASHTGEQLHQGFDRWMTSYEQAGIEGMSRAVLYCKRSPRDWEAVLEADHPTEVQTWVRPWLNSLDQEEPPSQLYPGARLWTNDQQARVEWPGTCLKPVDLSPAELRTLEGASTELAFELRRRLILA